MKRRLGNWLQAYRDYTAESESPDTLHMWTALSVLASALRREVWLDQGHFVVYPNLYVILVGPAGGPMKSTAMNLGMKLLREVEGVFISPPSMTAEQLLVILSHKPQLTISSKELSGLVGPSGLKMYHYLTELYGGDYEGDEIWDYETKHQGRNRIENACINLLACTTPSWIAEGMPAGVVEHGFTARTIFVFEEKERFLKPRPKRPSEALKEDLIHDLRYISELAGEMEWTTESGLYYDKLYEEIKTSTRQDHRTAAYFVRKAVHVIKVAMLLHLAESDSLVIEARDLKVAMALLAQIENKMHKVFSAVGKYELAMDVERVYAQILTSGALATSELMERNLHLGVGAVKEILLALEAMRRVRIDRKGADPLVSAVGRQTALGERSQMSGPEMRPPSRIQGPPLAAEQPQEGAASAPVAPEAAGGAQA